MIVLINLALQHEGYVTIDDLAQALEISQNYEEMDEFNFPKIVVPGLGDITKKVQDFMKSSFGKAKMCQICRSAITIMKQHGGEVSSIALGGALSAACASASLGVGTPICIGLAGYVGKIGGDKFNEMVKKGGLNGVCKAVKIC